MKKSFKYYVAAWALLLALFNAVVFTVRMLPVYTVSYDANFWTAYAFVTFSFIGQLACAYIAFSEDNREKIFLSIPLITKSYTAAVFITVIALVCMLIPGFPAWITAILAIVIFMFSAVGLVKAKAAADMVEATSNTVREKTAFIKLLTVDAETLLASAKSEEAKAECRKVYEAVRYSDPMSNDALAAAEAQITLKFDELKNAVAAGDLDAVKDAANAVLVLVKDRNNKCRLLK